MQYVSWIARRARNKRTFPGHLDNVTAGGQSIGFTPMATLTKECDEEAGIPAPLAAQASPVGSINYVMQEELSRKDDVLACFDVSEK